MKTALIISVKKMKVIDAEKEFNACRVDCDVTGSSPINGRGRGRNWRQNISNISRQ